MYKMWWKIDEDTGIKVVITVLIMIILIILIFALISCDNNDTILDNVLIENCQLIGYNTRMVAKSTNYYITIQKDGIKTEYETDSNTYTCLKELKETAKALNKTEDFLIDMIVDVNEKETIAVALASNKSR